jgi:transcriptional regulator GlxA family with amidase domain
MNPIVREARLWLEERLNETVDLTALASHLGVNYSALRRSFKLHTGFGLHEYQLELRVSESKKLPADTELPVKAIAGQLGFQEANYFSRLFKTKTGRSPEGWRHQLHGGDHLARRAMRPKPQRKPRSPAR